jgi:FMN phosphatase YigB (HAD superfamily)
MPRTTLITDFDNTLYDWFHVWYQSFSAMLAEIQRISGIDETTLIPEIRAIHQKYHTSEYAFLIEELPCLKQAFPNQDLRSVFDEAVHAYRRARKATLTLYEGVSETLTRLRSEGVLVIIYTESLAFYTHDRIRRLGLDSLVDFIYSPADHDIPASVTHYSQRDDGDLTHAKHLHIPAGVIKPDPAVLIDIVREIGRPPSECIYLGDSLMKDVAMAQDAGVTDVFAEYGGVQHKEEYELLRRVSHWTDADVQREKETSKRTVKPSYLISGFSEIRQFFGS